MLKRLILLALFLAVLVAPTAAQEPTPTTEDVTALAVHFPETAPVFIGWRVDDAYLTTLSDLLDGLNQTYDLGLNATLLEELDRISGAIPGIGGTYEEVFGSWLGDTIALGALSVAELYDDKPENDATTPWLVALDVDDSAAALEFWELALASMNYDVERTDNGTLFTPPPSEFIGSQPVVLITDEALFLASVENALPPNQTGGRLSDLALFNDTIAELPAPQYNGVLFVNTALFFGALAQEGGIFSQMNMSGGLSQDYFDLLGSLISAQTWGFTILDGDSLVMDIAQPLGDLSPLEDFGLAGDFTLPPFDPAFARFIPAGTPVVLQAADLRSTLEINAANLETTLELQGDLLDQAAPGFDPEQIGAQLAQLGTLFEGATGLDPVEDVIRWMDGDYAIVADFSETLREARTFDDTTAAFPVDFAVIIDASTDPAAAQTAAQEIGDAIRVLTQGEDEISVSSETIGGVDVWVFAVEAPDMQAPIEILLGADENVFVVGTRHFVQFALAPDGGLDSDASYQAANAYLVPDAALAAYIFGERLESGLQYFLDNARESDVQAARLLIGLFGQSSISSSFGDGTVSLARAVLTLP
ncbi:MAG: DUF3352 domain-containing protein [bacterium]|nr:DUF3352 domain-containing protein [bacterium]